MRLRGGLFGGTVARIDRGLFFAVEHPVDIYSNGHELAEFKSTCWGLVLAATSPDGERQAALQQLCEIYWYPLYAYARRLGHSQHDAMDLTQGFFTQLLEGQGLSTVRPEKGRFRSFLLASLKNYIRNDYRDKRAQKRGGRIKFCSLSEHDLEGVYQSRVTSQDTPDTIFDREWAETLLTRVLGLMRDHYTRSGRLKLFEALHAYLVASEDRLPQTQIAADLGMSVPAVKMSVRRMRELYSKLLRDEVARTLGSYEEVDDELNRMIRKIGR